MNEKQMIKTVNTLLLIASICIFNGVINIVPYKEEKDKQALSANHIINLMANNKVEQTHVKIHKDTPPAMVGERILRNEWMSVEITYITVETEYLCRGYITAYCAEECGWNYYTSSGEICHYEEAWYEPTTCAIDRSLFYYGDLFMIDGKVYIAEDTGSAVKGLHWDLYRESMSEVQWFNSHYTEVYSVEYIEHKEKRRFLHEYFNYHLLRSMPGTGFLCGPCSGACDG